MKNSNIKEIKTIIKRQLKKLYVPFLLSNKTNKNDKVKPVNSLRLLPKLLFGNKSTENEEKFSNIFTQTPKITTTKPKLSQIFTNFALNTKKLGEKLTFTSNFAKIQPKIDQLNTKSSKKARLDKIFVGNFELPSKINAKLDENATTAGGSESPKLIMFQKPNKTKKELVLVGEKGKELIDRTNKSIIPIDLLKGIQSNNTLTNSKKETNAKIKAKDDLGGTTEVILPKHDMRSVIAMIESGSVDNKVKNNRDGSVEISASAQWVPLLMMAGRALLPSLGRAAASAIGRGSAQSMVKGAMQLAGRASPKIGGGGMSSASSNPLMSKLGRTSGGQGLGSGPSLVETPQAQEQPQQQAPPQEESKSSGGGLLGAIGGVGAAVGGLSVLNAAPSLAAAGLGAGVAGIAGVAGALSKGLGKLFSSDEKEKMEENSKDTQNKNQGGKPPFLFNSNAAAPTSITNVSYIFDTYKKTAEDSFMLPNYRREYG